MFEGTDEIMWQCWNEWINGGNRNPFQSPSSDPIEQAKSFAYYSYFDNMTDRRPCDLTAYDFEQMADDPDADRIHEACLLNAEERWEEYLEA